MQMNYDEIYEVALGSLIAIGYRPYQTNKSTGEVLATDRLGVTEVILALGLAQGVATVILSGCLPSTDRRRFIDIFRRAVNGRRGEHSEYVG